MRRLAQIVFFGIIVKPFLTLFIGLRVRGLQNLPKSDPFLLVANHSSHLDTISLLSLFPMARLHRIQPVAAADYFERNRVISLVSRTLFNILPISRRKIGASNNPLDAMCDALTAGRSLILFPEGTRGAGDMQSFRPGVAHLIENRPEVPVVPVYLINMGRSLPKGQFVPVPLFCEVRIGPPMYIKGSRREILARLQEAVQSLKENG